MNWPYLLTSFDGRIGRQTFWRAFLPVLAVEIVLYVIAYRLDGERLAAIVELASSYPEFAIFAKRGHDRNISPVIVGLFFAFGVFLDFLVVLGLGGSSEEPSNLMRMLLVPWIVFALALLADLGLRRGTVGPNRFGPDPLGKA